MNIFNSFSKQTCRSKFIYVKSVFEADVPQQVYLCDICFSKQTCRSKFIYVKSVFEADVPQHVSTVASNEEFLTFSVMQSTFLLVRLFPPPAASSYIFSFFYCTGAWLASNTRETFIV
jgi:hypothetical protein